MVLRILETAQLTAHLDAVISYAIQVNRMAIVRKTARSHHAEIIYAMAVKHLGAARLIVLQAEVLVVQVAQAAALVIHAVTIFAMLARLAADALMTAADVL